MARFTITHELPCDVDTFWKTFFDRDFNVELYTRALRFPSFEILSQTETETQVTRKVSAQPRMELPAALQKLAGAGFRYTEEGTLTRAEGVWRFRTTPSTLADKLKIGGELRVASIGEGKVRRTAEMVVEAKVFGVGGLIESSSEKQTREAWDASAVFMRQYLGRARG